MRTLWFNKPAKVWEEALPLGNGKLGAMIFGGIERERISLNEETMWYGGYTNRNNPDAKEQLPKVRELIFAGNIAEAERLLALAFAGCPHKMRVYQALGDMILEQKGLGKITNYKRELNLEDALCRVTYTAKDTLFCRESFISAPDNVFVQRITRTGSQNINLEIRLEREPFCNGNRKEDEASIAFFGRLGDDGLSYYAQLSGEAKGGRLYTMGRTLVVEDAEEVLLFFCASTNFRGDEPKDYVKKKLHKSSKKGYGLLKRDHIEDYQHYFKRVKLDLFSETNKGTDVTLENILPTDQLLACAREEEIPTRLVENYFDFGRYLLISSSRPGTLPANLQGIWNKDMNPPWGSKFTININAQMNYWPAEICNLPECHTALLDHIERMVEHGRETAETMYGCRGFVAHHNTDIWGDTAPQDLWIPGTFWVMGAAWLCTHQWTHYLYTQDKKFLQKAFPIMREAAQFFLDFMVEKDGFLVTCPSVSPENTFILPNGEKGCNSAGVTMDNQILRDLFMQCIQAAEILGVNDDLNKQIKAQLARLRMTMISKNGTILEWDRDYTEAEPGHRHISHLYGLYPSTQITLEDTPSLAAAAEKTLERRLSMGGGHTGWSCAWIINLYARLQKSEKSYDMLRKLFTNSTLPNLFDNHPPFQIDGNFGATAAIVELLIQARNNKIFLLPALPKQWKDGRISGVKLPGNAEATLCWNDGKVVEFTVTTENRKWYAEVFEGGEPYPLKIVYK